MLRSLRNLVAPGAISLSAAFVVMGASCRDDETPKPITAKKGGRCYMCTCDGVFGEKECANDCGDCPGYAFDPDERVMLRCADNDWIVEAYCAGGGEALCPGALNCVGHDGMPGGYRYGDQGRRDGSEKIGALGDECRPCIPCDTSRGPCYECVSCDTYARDLARRSILECAPNGRWQLLRNDCIGDTIVQCDVILKTIVVCLNEKGENKFWRLGDAGSDAAPTDGGP